MFTVEGDCVVVNNCVSSSNYPVPHDNSESCVVTANEDVFLTWNSVFEIETCCDHLMVGEVDVDQIDEQTPTSLDEGEQILWSSDFSVSFTGWQVCFSTDQSKNNS